MNTINTGRSETLNAPIDRSTGNLLSFSCSLNATSGRRGHVARTSLLTLGLISLLGVAQAQTVFQGIGAGNAATAMNNFRTAIGGSLNTVASPQVGGRREINWDGVLLDGTDFGGNTVVIDLNHTVGIPVNRFQSRGVIFREVYSVSGDGFASVNPDTAGDFPSFSPNNVFSMFSDNTIEMKFVDASAPTSTPVAAGVSGFGAIFIDVQVANTSSIEYFNGAKSLGKYFLTPGNAGDPQFLGVLFDQPIITGATLTVGNKILFFFNTKTKKITPGGDKDVADGEDITVTDDFVYAEPTSAAAIPTSLTLSPVSVLGGKKVTGTVHLNAAAPSGGEAISLLSSNAAAVVPATVTVPAGSKSAPFSITTDPVAAKTSATITAFIDSLHAAATLTITAPIPSTVTFSPNKVVGGKTSTGKVTLNGATAVNTTVKLAIASGKSAVKSMPSSITIPAGSTSATFSVVTKEVDSQTTVQINATADGASKAGTLTVTP